MLPTNVTATTSVAEAIAGARYAVHALPVQHSRAFLTSIKVRACLFPNCRSTQLGTKGCTLLKLHLHNPPPPLPRPQANTPFCKQQLHLQCEYLLVQFMLYLAHQHITQSGHIIASWLVSMKLMHAMLKFVSWADCRTYCRMMYLSSRSAKA